RVVHLESATRGREIQSQSEHLFLHRWRDRVRHDELDYLLEDGLLSVSHTHHARLVLDIDPAAGRVRDADPLAAERVIDDLTARWIDAAGERDALRAAAHRREPVNVEIDSTGHVAVRDRSARWTDASLTEVWARADYLRRKCAPLDLRVLRS